MEYHHSKGPFTVLADVIVVTIRSGGVFDGIVAAVHGRMGGLYVKDSYVVQERNRRGLMNMKDRDVITKVV
jgi:hypothetical protein